MLTPVAGRRYRVDDLYNFPEDGKRYEIVQGELLVTPAPTGGHQSIVTDLVIRLGVYLRANRAASRVMVGPADIIYDEQTWVQPDLFVAPDHEITNDWRACRNLLLVVEVVSPSSVRGDRVEKRRAYLEHGVATYWVVDPDARVVEEWHPGSEVPQLISGSLVWRFGQGAPELVVPLAELWAVLPER